MKNIYTLFLIIILSLVLFSCKRNISQNDYPDADAVFISMTKEYTLNDDGSMGYHYSQSLKLFTYFAINNKYGETFIPYNPKYQKLKVNKSVTITSNGSLIPSPDNAYNEVLPQFAANAPDYNYLREMVISHTGLERNSTINLDYTLISSKGFQPALFADEVINSASPEREMNLIIRIPVSKKLSYKLINSQILPDSSVEKDFKVYKWQFKEVPPQPLEALQPKDNSNLIRLIFSTSNNYNEILSGIVKQPAFNFKIDEDMKQDINKVKDLRENEVKTILELQKKVVEEFNYYPIPPEYTDYYCRTPQEIWKSNGGTELEKTVLLASFYKEVGISSEILAYSSPNLSPKDKIALLFDNFVLKVILKNKDILYLSPIHINENNMSYDLSGDAYYPLSANTQLSYFSIMKSSNKLNTEGALTIKKNEIEGSINSTFTDNFNPYFKLTSSVESAKTLMTDVKEAKLKTLTPQLADIEFAYENKKAIKEEKNFVFFTLPEVSNGFTSWNIKGLPEQRTTTLQIQSDIDESYLYTLTMPDNYKLVSPSGNFSIQNNIGKFIIEINQNKNVLTFKRELKINSNKIDPKDYHNFMELTQNWFNKKYSEIIINSNQ